MIIITVVVIMIIIIIIITLFFKIVQYFCIFFELGLLGSLRRVHTNSLPDKRGQSVVRI